MQGCGIVDRGYSKEGVELDPNHMGSERLFVASVVRLALEHGKAEVRKKSEDYRKLDPGRAEGKVNHRKNARRRKNV